MNKEVRQCQNCQEDFTIETEDFVFYDKIKVPPPTFCPDCSHQRRFAWRNTHALYKRPDSVTDKDLISIYHPDVKMNVVDQKYWWGDQWDPFDYGRDFDFSVDFFSQWRALRDVVPFQALSNSKSVNSDYCNVAEENYDCYLCSACWKNERTMYSDSITKVKDSSDLYVVHNSEFCYQDIYCIDSYKIFYCEKTNSSTDSYFLYDCKGCVNCFMSSNLRNKSYCFNNIQYSKEEYFEKIKQYDLGSYNTIQKLKKDFEELKLNSIHKYAALINCHNATGNDLSGVVDSQHIFDASGNVKNTKYLYWAAENIFDCYYCNAIGLLENSFESCDSGVGGTNCNFSNVVYNSSNVEYSFNCYNSHDLFGCIGLRNKSYCILNKQYSKEEYFDTVGKIKKHMMDMPYVDQKGRVYRYGEFFPIEFSPFAYNETIANYFYPLSKEDTISNGYLYRDKDNQNHNPTIKTEQIPDSIIETSLDILKEIISCDTFPGSDRCSGAFRLTQDELTFYKRFNIPIPRMCYQCRHKERFSKRTPLKLWNRKCMHEGCDNEFQTSYAPDRPEIIYCEKCYQQEVI